MLDQEKKFLCDKFKYSHYLFAIQCMDIMGRSYVWILWEEVTLQSLLEVKD